MANNFMSPKQIDSNAIPSEDVLFKIQALNEGRSICEVFSCYHFNKNGCQNYDVSRQATIENCPLAGKNNTVLNMEKKLIHVKNPPKLEEFKVYAECIEAVQCELAPIVEPGQPIPKIINWANRKK
jgi:hypothetical protein